MFHVIPSIFAIGSGAATESFGNNALGVTETLVGGIQIVVSERFV
jgi:hypothetical protein